MPRAPPNSGPVSSSEDAAPAFSPGATDRPPAGPRISFAPAPAPRTTMSYVSLCAPRARPNRFPSS